MEHCGRLLPVERSSRSAEADERGLAMPDGSQHHDFSTPRSSDRCKQLCTAVTQAIPFAQVLRSLTVVQRPPVVRAVAGKDSSSQHDEALDPLVVVLAALLAERAATQVGLQDLADAADQPTIVEQLQDAEFAFLKSFSDSGEDALRQGLAFEDQFGFVVLADAFAPPQGVEVVLEAGDLVLEAAVEVGAQQLFQLALGFFVEREGFIGKFDLGFGFESLRVPFQGSRACLFGLIAFGPPAHAVAGEEVMRVAVEASVLEQLGVGLGAVAVVVGEHLREVVELCVGSQQQFRDLAVVAPKIPERLVAGLECFFRAADQLPVPLVGLVQDSNSMGDDGMLVM